MRIILTIVILFFIIILFSNNNLTNIISPQNTYFSCQKKALEKCHVPTLSNQKCLSSKYYKCPQTNGSYEQCTNNYWSYDGVCDCANRTFEMCPHKYKISGKCYQEEMKKCPSLTLKERDIVEEPCENPRINMYHSDKYKSSISNGYILY
jgi:hypothetical protein